MEHALLKYDATDSEVEIFCENALASEAASICVLPTKVELASDLLENKLPISAAIGYPFGVVTTKTKVYEAKEALSYGATELAVTINAAMIQEGAYSSITREIDMLRKTVGNSILTAVLNLDKLSLQEIKKSGEASLAGSVDYLKTCTVVPTTFGNSLKILEELNSSVGNNVRIVMSQTSWNGEEAVAMLEAKATKLSLVSF